MSPRVMEQISAVEANKIFTDDEKNTFYVSAPLSAPIRRNKAFWSGLLVETDVKAEDSEDCFPSKYTVPTLELSPRRLARRRSVSVILNPSRPPSRQQTAFPMDLELDLTFLLPEQRHHQSRLETSTAACTHKDKHKIHNLRELLSDSDRDHIDNMAYNQSRNNADMARPSSCAARISSCDKHFEQGNISKSPIMRPTTRRKVNAFHLNDLSSHTEIGDRRALSDRNSRESKNKNVWVDMAGPKTRKVFSDGNPVLTMSV